MAFRKQVVPDKVILKQVNQRLMRAGLGAGCSVRVSVRNGQVTLAGTIQRDLQRRPAVRAATGIDGVKQVVDQLKIEVKKIWTAPKKVVPAANLSAETMPANEETGGLVAESENQTHDNQPS